MQWSPHAPASGAPGTTCLSPPQLAAVGTPSCSGPLPRDWTVCLSAALFILLLCEREFSSWQTAALADFFSHLGMRVHTRSMPGSLASGIPEAATHSPQPFLLLPLRAPGGHPGVWGLRLRPLACRGNLISGSSAFCKTSLTIWKFKVQVLLKPGLEVLKSNP